MAVGTIGGKFGCVAGPLLAVLAMVFSVGWFGISEDKGPWHALVGWLVFGLVVAVAAGLAVRKIVNRVARQDDEWGGLR